MKPSHQTVTVLLSSQGVCLVLSVSSESSLQNTVSKRKGTVSFPLGQLSLPDKKEIVQKQLVEFGKKLSDSAFNNQVNFPFAVGVI